MIGLSGIGSPVTPIARDQECIDKRLVYVRVRWPCCPHALLQLLRRARVQQHLVLAIRFVECPILICLLVCKNPLK